MSLADTFTPVGQIAGDLLGLDAGQLYGQVSVTKRIIGNSTVSVEVFVRGVFAAGGEVRGPFVQEGEKVPFTFRMGEFPRVDFPCTIEARIVETDELLKSHLEISSLDELLMRMVAFRVTLERFDSREIRLRVEDGPEGIENEVFELYDADELLGVSRHVEHATQGGVVFSLDLPETLLHGNKHLLTIRHQGSGLPVTSQPLYLKLDLGLTSQTSDSDVLERVERMEARLGKAYAEAFNSLAPDLYRHVALMMQVQRANFEREIAALRALHNPGAMEDGAEPALPSGGLVEFGSNLLGYGLGPIQVTSAGKAFREVAALSGILLPGLAAEELSLRIQGLRRSHPQACDEAELFVNGERILRNLYCSKTSESWNITAQVPSRLIQAHGNLMELRFPNGPRNGPTNSDPNAPVAGILYVELTASRDKVAG